METINYVQYFLKIGYIFANCDGNYHIREKEYIENYISYIVAKQAISHTEYEALLNLDYSSYTIDDVIAELKLDLQNCDTENRDLVLNTFNVFIENVIGADGVIVKEEEVLYERWKASFK